ncbi:polymorphic toxin-type HINT domain-containing protein [Paractinoplanes rishiriensis]|uniref:Type IV secretion protein Rhs n=1 Tax=Paractinoplanes rishiriensis TaxID=1050105 RepID=A0A919K5S1_9ACTN|nr:polymorphic toxin-type HINT domain-containing protein [Actinoplanes rishiriensis]GIF00649.1 type IV secretion protein Rhs [Actinoplanes rishiriensis]
MRAWLAFGMAVTCLVTVVAATPAAAAPPDAGPSKPSPGVAVDGVKPSPYRFTTPKDAAKKNYRPRATRWPKAATAQLKLKNGRTRAAAAPVWASRATDAGPSQVEVKVLDQTTAQRSGVAGVLVKVTAKQGAGRTRVGIDYGGFAEAYGGNFSSRLRLVQLPTCALSTPEVASCRTATPLATTNDRGTHEISAEVGLTANTQSVVLAAAAAPGTDGAPGGTYAASDLKASGSWSGGNGAGSFTYSYPVAVPPAAGGLAPTVALKYDSSAVDGQTAASQAQASWVGDGWSTPKSYVEQSFASCKDNPGGSAAPKKTDDLCYNGPTLTLSLNGSSSTLVFDKTKNVWKPESDDGEVVTRVTGSNNGSGTAAADYWTVTTRDGSVYQFGRNRLPGWTADKATTNSVDTVPVYSPHAGDPCYNAAGFEQSMCTTARRWNLDYVTDAHGNAMAYYYQRATNHYGRNQGATATAYVRDSYLERIDYGFRDGGAYGTVANQVVFGTGNRCLTGTCQPLNESTKANWPDVPYDLICDSGATCQAWAPSYFSTVRLTSITTKQYSSASGQHEPVDSYALTQTMPATGDGTSPTLWLSSIVRTGHDTTGAPGASPITLPPVTFSGTKLQNRVTASDGLPAYYRQRLQSITTESGSVITVGYELPQPCGATSGLNPATNTKSCYPIRWTPEGYTEPILDWFNTYAVTRVTTDDPTGGAPLAATSYAYLGGAAWHYDDDETVKAKHRTYGEFRGYAKVQTFVGDGDRDRRTQTEAVFYRGMSKNNNSTVVNVTDSLGGVHEDHDELAGNTLESITYQGESGPVDSSTIRAYWISAATATRARDGLPALTAKRVETALTVQKQRITGAGAGWRYQQTDSTYDTNVDSPTFGVLKTSYSHTVPANAAYDRCTTNTYAPTSSNSRVVGLIAQTETVAVACGGFSQNTPASVPSALNTLTPPATVSRPAQVVSHTRMFYDDPDWSTTFPQTAAPTKGDLTMTQAAADYTNGAYTYQTTARASYDDYGRKLHSYDGNNNLTKTSYSMIGELETGSTITKPLGHTTSTTVSPRRGLVTSAKDINDLVSSQQYDALGRTTAAWLHGRPTTAPANHKFTYRISNTGISAVTSENANDANGYIKTVALYDAMLRPRQTQAVTHQSGRLVTDTFYDSRGWIAGTNNGWWDDTTTPAVGPPANAKDIGRKVPNQTINTYDGLGRAVIVEQAKDDVTVSKTVTVHNGDRTTVIPPTGGTVITTLTDPLGRTTSLREYTARPTLNTPSDTFTGTFTVTGGTTVNTTYGYDARGNQNSVTDVQNNPWTRQYNLLGQLVGKTDPDAGSTTDLTYDGNGNLLQSTDARGKTVSSTYDELNRQTATFAAPTASQSASNQLTALVYDNTNNAVANMTYPKGHLTTATSFSGGQPYKFQVRGFTVRGDSTGEVVTIPPTEGALAGAYTVLRTYTDGNFLLGKEQYQLKHGLPQETVTHQYDAFDKPNSLGGLGGYVQTVNKDAYGRVEQQTIGASTNLAVISNTFDEHTGLITGRKVTRQVTTPRDVAKQEFAYDLAGNPTRQTDTRLAANNIGETQCFRYDELRRLTSAWTATDSCATNPTTANRSMVGNTIGGGSAYWTSWVFDELGNRTSQIQHALPSGTDTTTDYKYDENGADQPHTLTSTITTGATTGSTSYAYDAAGYMTSRNAGNGNQTLTWTDTGKLNTVSAAGATSSNVYGPDGELLLQKDPGSVTLYLGTQQFVRNTATNTVTGTRYYALPGGGTVIRTGATSSYSFAFTDRHGTPTLYLDSTAQIPTWRQYTPYGDRRGATITVPDNRGFLNKTLNSSTGLLHVGAREYDMTIGRFISVDPIQDLSDPQQWNGYSYANNNPITLSDPTGLKPAGCEEERRNCRTLTPLPGSDGKEGDGRNGKGQPAKVRYGVAVTAAPDWKTYTNGWLATVREWQRPHWLGGVKRMPRPECMQGAPTCQGADVLDVVLFAQLLCKQPGFSCTGHESPLGAALAAAKDSGILFGGRDGSGAMGAKGPRPGQPRASSCNSFAPGTLVLLADGFRRAIEDVQVGDVVVTTDPESGKTTTKKITALHLNNDSELTSLTIKEADGSQAVVETTWHHKFWSKTQHAWMNAADLKAGEVLTSVNQAPITVSAVRNYTGAQAMHDLTVADIHTYYVLAGNTPVLVHNDGGAVIPWGDPNAFDPNSLRGMSAAEIEAAIPDTWERVPSASGGGVVYKDPKNFGRQIRVMPGYTAGNRPDALTHGPYVQVSQNGAKAKVPLAGNPTLGGGC